MRISKILSLLFGLFVFLASAKEAMATLTSFEFNDFASTQYAGSPIYVRIRALNENGQVETSFNDSVALSDDTGTLSADFSGDFNDGVWYGALFITEAAEDIQIHCLYSALHASTEEFTVVPDDRVKFVSVVSGANQTGMVREALPAAIVAKVVDPYDNPIAGQTVNFNISSYPPNASGQLLSSTTGTTNANGQVSTALTLGTRSGTYVIDANMIGGITNAVHFYETAIAGPTVVVTLNPPTAVLIRGSFLQFEAKAFDQYLNEKVIPSITWEVVNGGGTVNASTGYFQAGNNVGNYLNTVRATVGSTYGYASLNIINVGGEGTGTGSGNGSGSGNGNGNGDGDGDADASGSGEAGVLETVVIDPEFISALAGATIPISATALDAFGNLATGVSYSFSTSGSLGTLSGQSGNSVLLTASENGIGTVTVTANQGKIAKVAKVVGSVGTGLNRRLIIDPIPSPQKVGEPFLISIAAKDSMNNFLLDYKGPLSIADTTGTIDPAVASPSASGLWYVQGIISLAAEKVTVTVAGDGMVGVSNIFSVEGDPKKKDTGPGPAGLAEIKGASIASQIKEFLLGAGGLSGGGKGDGGGMTSFKYIGAGLAAGFGILGACVGGSIMVSKALEALGRNPFAKGRLQFNLYGSVFAFVAAAGLAVVASFLILR